MGSRVEERAVDTFSRGPQFKRCCSANVQANLKFGFFSPSTRICTRGSSVPNHGHDEVDVRSKRLYSQFRRATLVNHCSAELPEGVFQRLFFLASLKCLMASLAVVVPAGSPRRGPGRRSHPKGELLSRRLGARRASN